MLAEQVAMIAHKHDNRILLPSPNRSSDSMQPAHLGIDKADRRVITAHAILQIAVRKPIVRRPNRQCNRRHILQVIRRSVPAASIESFGYKSNHFFGATNGTCGRKNPTPKKNGRFSFANRSSSRIDSVVACPSVCSSSRALHVEPAHRKAKRRAGAAREHMNLVLFLLVAARGLIARSHESGSSIPPLPICRGTP